MESYLPLLQSTSLFTGIDADSLRALLGELGAVIRTYGRGEALVLAGAPNRRVGVVLSGGIEAYRPAPGGARIPDKQLTTVGARVQPEATDNLSFDFDAAQQFGTRSNVLLQ